MVEAKCPTRDEADLGVERLDEGVREAVLDGGNDRRSVVLDPLREPHAHDCWGYYGSGGAKMSAITAIGEGRVEWGVDGDVVPADRMLNDRRRREGRLPHLDQPLEQFGNGGPGERLRLTERTPAKLRFNSPAAVFAPA